MKLIDAAVLCLTAIFREAADLAALGPRPPWWRARARRRYDRAAAHLKRAHTSDLRAMLAAQDSQQRAILAQLIGWQQPTELR